MADEDRLADKQAIHEVVLRYCRAVDRLDGDLLRSCFHPDAAIRYGGFSGGPDELVAWLLPMARSYASTFHLIGNHLVELRGEQAASEAYGVAVNVGDPGTGTTTLFTGFRHVDRFERRDGTWRIAERQAVREVSGDGSWLHATPPAADGPGRRDRGDVVYRILGA